MIKNQPLKVVILCGGQSAEHEVSLRSARFFLDVLHTDVNYELTLFFIDQRGKWFYLSDYQHFFSHDWKKHIEPIYLVPGETVPFRSAGNHVPIDVDIVLPVLHGTKGEDGIQQGLLEALNLPYVGASVLGSAICMDKDIVKRLLRGAGLPVVNGLTLSESEFEHIDIQDVLYQVGLPLIVKPAGLGSSIGVAKVTQADELVPMMQKAYRYDRRVMIEEFISGRELECAVLGGDVFKASQVGEIIPINYEFYSYRAKYIDDCGVELKIPASLRHDILESIQKIAIKTVQVLRCAPMARVDFFLTDNETIFVNEVNTIPGFTSISMYPRLWEVSGMQNDVLVQELLKHGLKTFKRNRELIHEYHE
jgi:D-alanine-D-alanine ligase